mgnify:CR=1 FL=1
MKRFEEVVDKDFLGKYLDEIRPEYNVVGKGGKINYGVLEREFFLMNGGESPNRFIYALLHGKTSLIPSWNIPTKLRNNEDGIYKYCLDRGLTWQEVFGDTVDDNILL